MLSRYRRIAKVGENLLEMKSEGKKNSNYIYFGRLRQAYIQSIGFLFQYIGS